MYGSQVYARLSWRARVIVQLMSSELPSWVVILFIITVIVFPHTCWYTMSYTITWFNKNDLLEVAMMGSRECENVWGVDEDSRRGGMRGRGRESLASTGRVRRSPWGTTTHDARAFNSAVLSCCVLCDLIFVRLDFCDSICTIRFMLCDKISRLLPWLLVPTSSGGRICAIKNSAQMYVKHIVIKNTPVASHRTLPTTFSSTASLNILIPSKE